MDKNKIDENALSNGENELSKENNLEIVEFDAKNNLSLSLNDNNNGEEKNSKPKSSPDLKTDLDIISESEYFEYDFIDDKFVGDKIENALDFVENPEPDEDTDMFLHSLEILTSDDIKESFPKKVKTPMQKFSDIARSAVFFGSLAIFAVCIFMLGENLIAKKRGEDIYSALADEIFDDEFSINFDDSPIEQGEVISANKSVPDHPSLNFATSLSVINSESSDGKNNANKLNSLTTTQENAEVAKMRAKLNSMQNVNSDIYGWIYIEGTNISYPLLQYTDNEYYLNHAYNGEYLVVGSIYVDYRCDESITKNFNTVMYGHNITNGTMFNHVTKFFKEDMFKNTKIQIFTTDALYIYEPFAIYETRYDYEYFKTSFKSADEFIKFAQEMQLNSRFNKNMTFNEDDRIITLSTCTNGAYYGRYALQAKLVSIIK